MMKKCMKNFIIKGMSVRLTEDLIALFSEQILKFEQTMHKLHISGFIPFQY